MRIINFSNQDELFIWAADDFMAQALKTLQHKEYFDVALSGGSTAQNFFQVLACKAKDFPCLKYTRFFVSDERAVDLSSESSNAGNAWRQLLAPLGLKNINFFPAFDNSNTPEEAAHYYELKISQLLEYNQDSLPVFDLIYLGIGLDGHTASIFPHSDLVKSVNTNKNLVAATEEEIAGFRRLSFMPRLINAAKNICIMAPGTNKAQVLDAITKGPLAPEDLPAQLIIRSNCANVTLLQSV